MMPREEPAGPGRGAAPYYCPMCAGVASASPGECPMCGMALERNPAAAPYTCPMHPEVRQFGHAEDVFPGDFHGAISPQFLNEGRRKGKPEVLFLSRLTFGIFFVCCWL